MTVLTRIRFESNTIALLDLMVRELGAKLGRSLSRASVVRAIVAVYDETPAIVAALEADSVRRGRARRSA